MGKNRDGAATDFQLKKLKALGFKGKKPTTYRKAENAIKRLTSAAKSDTTSAQTSKQNKHGYDVEIKAVPLPEGVRVVGLVFKFTKKKASKK